MAKPDVTYDGVSYRLRAGAPMSKGKQGAGDFFVHTFMAEENEFTVYGYTETLPRSTDFRGQGGDLVSGQFSRLSSNDGLGFSGKTTNKPNFIEETDIP